MADLLNIETDIERELTNYLRDELNSNPQNVLFRMGFYHAVETNGQVVGISDEMNKYVKMPKRYVPCVIETYEGNILALEGIFNIEYTIPMTFQIDIEQDNPSEKEILDAINYVKNKNRGKLKRLSVDIGDGKTQYFTMTVTTDNLTPSGDVEVFKGTHFVFATINFYFNISLDVVYGNQMHLYLRYLGGEDGLVTPENEYQRLYPIIPQFERDVTPENIQTFGTVQAQNIAQESEFTFTVGLVMKDDDLHWQLLEDALKKNQLHSVYELKMEFWRFNKDVYEEKFTPFEEKVIILDKVVSMTIGEEMVLSLTFQKALDDDDGLV